MRIAVRSVPMRFVSYYAAAQGFYRIEGECLLIQNTKAYQAL